MLGFSGEDDLEAGCRVLLERGVGMVAATTGADGALIVTGEGEPLRVPAFAVDVVDTTGCGDAFSAGFLVGLGLGRGRRARPRCSGTPPRRSSAGGLGSDHGDFDLAAADAFAKAMPTRE